MLFVCLVPFVCVGRCAFLTGGNAFLPYAGEILFFVLFAAHSCTVHDLFFASILFSLSGPNGDLWVESDLNDCGAVVFCPHHDFHDFHVSMSTCGDLTVYLAGPLQTNYRRRS